MTNIREILPIQSVTYKTTDMYIYLCNKLKAMGIPFETDRGNIYATKNPKNNPLVPCFVSHIDTVHAITDEIHVLEFYEGRILTGFNRVKMTQTGIGGDDKVGIYYCIKALEQLDAVKVAFFRDEERGCLGSAEAKMGFFKDVSMVLQGDRKGHNDFVTKISGIDLSEKDFQNDVLDIVTTHDYKFCTFGGTTDVGQLRKNGITVPVVNISCGYYNPHSKDEYIDMVKVENGLSMFLEIARTFGEKEYYIEKYTTPVYTPKTYPLPTKPIKTKAELAYGEYVWCASLKAHVTLDSVYYYNGEYILKRFNDYTLMPTNYVSKEDNGFLEEDDNFLDGESEYYEIEITPGYYEGIEVRAGSSLEEIIDVAVLYGYVTLADSLNMVNITKIDKSIYDLHYEEEI